ncbi:hypothetical protein A2U01_0029200, partial [Trifolium medium]|nr:hypothetical protein [Trifolium medium]
EVEHRLQLHAPQLGAGSKTSEQRQFPELPRKKIPMPILAVAADPKIDESSPPTGIHFDYAKYTTRQLQILAGSAYKVEHIRKNALGKLLGREEGRALSKGPSPSST